MSVIVSNASPIIILSMIRELGRLQELFGSVRITPEIYEEVATRGRGRPGSAELAAATFFRVQPVSEARRIAEVQAAHQIGLGEASTLVLAKEAGADLVILDDKQARSAARAEGLKLAGTLRVLEWSHERGLIKDLASVYRRLAGTPARIKGELLDESLKRHGLPPMK